MTIKLSFESLDIIGLDKFSLCLNESSSLNPAHFLFFLPTFGGTNDKGCVWYGCIWVYWCSVFVGAGFNVAGAPDPVPRGHEPGATVRVAPGQPGSCPHVPYACRVQLKCLHNSRTAFLSFVLNGEAFVEHSNPYKASPRCVWSNFLR